MLNYAKQLKLNYHSIKREIPKNMIARKSWFSLLDLIKIIPILNIFIYNLVFNYYIFLIPIYNFCIKNYKFILFYTLFLIGYFIYFLLFLLFLIFFLI